MRLYHETTEECAISILANGLCTKYDRTGFGAVFLSDTPPAPSSMVCLVVEWDEQELNHLREQEILSEDFTTEPYDNEQWYACFSDVHPRFIRTFQRP